MKTILMGFDRTQQGIFEANDGQKIHYSNRICKFMTDSGSNGQDVFGFSGFEVKLKSKDICRSLGIPSNDEWKSLDNWLLSHIQKPVEVIYAPVNNVMVAVGLRVLPEGK